MKDNENRKVATRKGLEPSTSAVTGRHSNQLNYRAVKKTGKAPCAPMSET